MKISKTLNIFISGLLLGAFIFMGVALSQDGSGDGDGDTGPGLTNSDGNAVTTSDGVPVGTCCAVGEANGGGTVGISEPVAPSAPIIGGTPSCPTSGQTCNGNYIYDHSVVCGQGGNTTYCTYECDNNGGSPTNFGAYCKVAPAPTVNIWFTP